MYNMIFFAEKMWVAFAVQKLLTFFCKTFQHICVSLNVNFKESLTNDIISFEQLGPGLYSQWINSVIYSATNHGRKRATLSGAIPMSFWHFADVSLRFHDIRRCNVAFSRVSNVRNVCKQQRHNQNCLRDIFMRWRKVGRIWRIQLLFCHFVCVRIRSVCIILHSLLRLFLIDCLFFTRKKKKKRFLSPFSVNSYFPGKREKI